MIRKRKIFTPLLIGVFIFFLIMTVFVTGGYVFAEILNFDGIYKGVYLEDISLEGREPNDIKSLLPLIEKKLEDTKVTITISDFKISYSYKELGYTFDLNKAIDTAYAVGRTGNVIERISDVFFLSKTNRYIPLPVIPNKEAIDTIVSSIYNKLFVEKKDTYAKQEDGYIVLSSGIDGFSFDITNFTKKLTELTTVQMTDIEINPVVKQKTLLDVDIIYNELKSEKKDATVSVVDNNVVITDDHVGYDIDYNLLNKSVKTVNESSSAIISIPITVVMPSLTKLQVQELLFRDILANKITYFSTNTVNNENRGANIALASEKIIGKILAPNEVFSFNETVGKRTKDDGFAVAHVYQGGKIIDGVGGGICQVSTTLYNAVLFSGLEIVERSNHYFIVSYVPLGQDATVSFGSKDFKFKNNTEWPIMINGYVKNNTVYFEIIGTNLYPNRKITLVNTTLAGTPFKIIEVPTNTRPLGERFVEMKGMNGYTVETVMVVYENDVEVSRKKLYTSTYHPFDEYIQVGTFVLPE